MKIGKGKDDSGIESEMPGRQNKKKCKPTSHRYDHLPLLPSGPGGVRQELVVPICNANIEQFFIPAKAQPNIYIKRVKAP